MVVKCISGSNETRNFAGIAQLSGVYVPFPHIVQFYAPFYVKKEKKRVSLCAFWNFNALKDLRRIVGLSLILTF